ncbi:right-handed parallel beta-helix repeat-containing protein [Ureibacillus thermophilus]|uniref:right-handed parallel beta-helix repeat-containing protein n=1 Tax=Ureibacillus thermophilus TaxID=367743 RepID=UPI0036103DAD
MIRSIYNMIFSKWKTLKNSLVQANQGEEIQLQGKKYKESIQINKDVTIIGDKNGQTILEGMFIIPKNIRVTFRNVTITATAPLYIEGEALFEQCTIKGNIDVLMNVNGGYVKGVDSEYKKAKEAAIALLNNASGVFIQCNFHHNKKTHLLIKNSKAFLEECKYSYAIKGLWIADRSFTQTKKCHFFQHSESQIFVEHSTYFDFQSSMERGEKFGIIAKNDSDINLHSTKLFSHASTQLFIDNSRVNGKHCTIQYGHECGFILQEGEGFLSYCEISNHPNNNVVAKKSLLHVEHCQIHSGNESGLIASKESIVNCCETLIKDHLSTQVIITEKSICSMKDSFITNGRHVGVCVEKRSECMLMACHINQNNNSAFNVDRAALKVYRCEISENNGNGILAITHSKVEVDSCLFKGNHMPHIASKSKVKIYISHSDFHSGKSLYLLHRCELLAQHSKFHDSMNVQIEITEHSTAQFEHCQIYNGKSYGIKVIKNSHLFFYHSQIYEHDLAQIVVNDSSVILNNSELYKGKRNGLFIQNHSEVHIQESFISKHSQAQIWVEQKSSLELLSVQLTDGKHSDLHAQNLSKVYVENSIIRNDQYRYNVQALNNSIIEIVNTIVENKYGDVYYSENNSSINNSDY